MADEVVFFGRRHVLSELPVLDTPPPTLERLRANRGNRNKPLETCDHDWRVDTVMVLQSLPPQQYVICARCQAVTTRRIPDGWEPG